jgi:quercetin dioxygenase-like cupin family protein
MKTFAPMIALALLVAPAAIAADAPKTGATTTNAAEIKWGEAPPDLPKGAALAVLHGDPAKKAPFTVRLKMPAGYKIPPHWHSNDEQLTVVSGTLILHMGDTMDAPASTLAAGGFHFLPGKAHHAAETKVETIVQVNGTGPFDIHYLNPADNPAKKAAVIR